MERELRTTHPTGGWGGGVMSLVYVFGPLVHVFVPWCVYISVEGFRLGKAPTAAQRHVFQVKLRALGAFSNL
jgi:hypothetical protein